MAGAKKMAAILTKLSSTIIAGFVLALVLLLILAGWYKAGAAFDLPWWSFFFRWLHVLSGVMWIGILWYFNFVQIPNMSKIEAAQRPAITQVIAPAALFWFRWAAMATIVTGLIVALMSGYLGSALSLQKGYHAIGLGMWLGIIMWFNVWFIIWPNQKKALGIVQVGAEEKTAAARTAMLVSRFNTMLSVPMLYAMVAQQNGGL